MSQPTARSESLRTSRPSPGMVRLARLALLALILVAFGLRVYRLAGQSLWYDEAVTAQVTAKGMAELTRWTADDIQPPLYYYAVAGWTHLAGRSEWALRFPSVAFGVLTLPLLWSLARRLFGRGWLGRVAGLNAALLAAVSPLYVYYGQEARMYTQLTCLTALAGYCLLRALTWPVARPSPVGRRKVAKDRGAAWWWAGFVLAATAILYTHYFGLFLLVAYALYVGLAWLLAAQDRRATRPAVDRHPMAVRPAVVAAVAVGIFYLPWLPAMLNRYQVDRSYWQGTLKMGEALRHVALSITLGAPETLREKFALPLLPWLGAAFAVALAALVWWVWQGQSARVATDPAAQLSAEPPPRQGVSALLFLLFMLVVPTVSVLALASRTPKFNARYLLLISPAYLLILGGGVAVLLCNRFSRRDLRILAALLAVAILGLSLVTSFQGLVNWYTSPTYQKAQWRELVGAVQRQLRPSEAVVLVSGHAAPAWSYYAPDIATINLPNTDILDVDAVLGFDAGPALAQALAGKDGAWLVQWQNEAVDPLGIVPYYLDRAGAEVPVKGQYTQLKLRHWQLAPGASYPDRPAPQHPDGANYGHKVALLGWDEPRQGQIDVYWQALAPLPESDFQVSLRVEDAAGREVGRGWDGRPAGYLYPTGRWQPGQPLFGRYPLPKDLPSGTYYVTLAVYDAADPSGLDVIDVANNPAGKRVRLGPFLVP
jgi:mannosyltransferase